MLLILDNHESHLSIEVLEFAKGDHALIPPAHISQVAAARSFRLRTVQKVLQLGLRWVDSRASGSHDDNLRHCGSGGNRIPQGHDPRKHPVGFSREWHIALRQVHFLPSAVTDMPNPHQPPTTTVAAVHQPPTTTVAAVHQPPTTTVAAVHQPPTTTVAAVHQPPTTTVATVHQPPEASIAVTVTQAVDATVDVLNSLPSTSRACHQPRLLFLRNTSDHFP